MNLLQFRPVAAIVRWSGFPRVPQALALGAFVALALLGWGRYAPESVNSKLYAKSNLVSLVIWGLWWPAIIWVTFWVGRVWCIVCPLELVASLAGRFGARLGLTQRPLGSWLARGSLVVLLFAALQMLVPGVQIHRVPHYTALFLVTSLTLAIAVGLRFKHRAFCRGFCPISLLLSAYGRGGMLAVRPADQGGRPTTAKAPNARDCPSLLNPARLNTSQDCLICGECLKADSAGAMRLLVRPPWTRADARESLASWPLTLFVMVVSGFITYELSGVWKAAGDVFLWSPAHVTAALNAGAAAGWIQGLWTLLVWPLATWLVLGGLTRLTGGANSLGEAWRRLAWPMAMVVATGHLAKGLEKFTSWIGFLPLAWAEPAGVQTALQLHAGTLPQPNAWLTLPTLSVLAMPLVALGVVLALRETRLTDPARAPALVAPILLLGGCYFILVFGWGGWVG